MNLFDMLYRLILGPLELLFDMIYAFALRVIGNPGFSLIFLSLAVNLLVLPLYKRADAIQEEERKISEALKPGIDHIKKVFKGDERVMVTQTYYRQNNYKPWYALKGTLSLLLQIPFFMAAYNYLSNLQLLQGVAFGPIRDLGAPDGLLRIAGITVNVLPVLMTLINIVSGAIYTRGMPLKSRLQLYGMAAIFLVLLYDSPAGLVFYWTLNNLFSLAKNAVGRRDLKPFLRWAAGALGVFIAVWFLKIRPVLGLRMKVIVAAAALALQLPWLGHLLRNTRLANLFRKGSEAATGKSGAALFALSCVILTVLTGLWIPSAVISSSPEEFVDIRAVADPLRYLLPSLLTAAGTFCVWCTVYYRLASEKSKAKYPPFFAFLALGGILNFMFFGREYGNLTAILKYDGDAIAVASFVPFGINLAALLLLWLAVRFFWKRKRAVVSAVCFAAVLAVSVQSLLNIQVIRRSYAETTRAADALPEDRPSFTLDKKGKNVLVLMMDRAISGYVPFLLEERPELREQFAGFAWYPNAFSFGAHTNVGAPPLFGGYDYTPDGMNARPEISLREKNNEALKIMPLNFLRSGYKVTVCDPPYANYHWIPDLSIYSDTPEIRAFVTEGAFTVGAEASAEETEHRRDRNLFCYGLMRAAPMLIHQDLYDGGDYNEAEMVGRDRLEDIWSEFMDGYLAVKHLPDMTVVTDSGDDTFMMLSNSMTHDVVYLQGPDFDPGIYNADSTYDRDHAVRKAADGRELSFTTGEQHEHYVCNMSAFILLGRWFDFMRENGVWDNTRIIIAADHGWYLGLNETLLGYPAPSGMEEPMTFNPLLMFKDFGDTEPLREDRAFHTTADVPSMAFRDTVEDPRNPFLGTPVTDEGGRGEQHATLTEWNIGINNGNTYMEAPVVTLKNRDLFSPENWSQK